MYTYLCQHLDSLVLIIASPIFALFIITELIYDYKKRQQLYSLKDSLSNFALSAMFQLADIACTVLFIKSIYTYIYLHGLQLFNQPSLLSLIILVIGQDFLYYWFHRSAHTVRWIWASHVTHHSSLKLNFSTAFRQSMTYPMSGMWLFWIPLAYLGFTASTIILIVSINLGFQFFIHTTMVKKIGFLEYIFNTPSHHRVHHAINPQYIDKNFAGLLIIWDRLFGTFIEEDATPIYGITRQVYTGFNPLRLTIHEWRDMLADTIKNRDFRHLFHAPDWQSDKQKTQQTAINQQN